jgi:hypothetical protein
MLVNLFGTARLLSAFASPGPTLLSPLIWASLSHGASLAFWLWRPRYASSSPASSALGDVLGPQSQPGTSSSPVSTLARTLFAHLQNSTLLQQHDARQVLRRSSPCSSPLWTTSSTRRLRDSSGLSQILVPPRQTVPSFSAGPSAHSSRP